MSESIEPLSPPDIAEDIKDLQLESSGTSEETSTSTEDNGNPAVVINSVKTNEVHEYSKPVQVEFEDVIELICVLWLLKGSCFEVLY
ncbi:hypothetical protein OROHE_003327 [Orobanche hederae]